MRLAWATDLHLDFLDPAERRAFAATVAAARPDGLVVTGDIATGPTVIDALRDLRRDAGVPLWFVLGNHDFYRSSIADVRPRARAVTAEAGGPAWLPATGVVRLGETTALLGHDGWGDGRLGDFAGTTVQLNDFYLIAELTHLHRDALGTRLVALGDEAAAHLRATVAEALTWARHLIVAIHVPPFREACWHEGQISDDDWLPFFTCAAAGEVLREAMAAHPSAHMTVLCGHTHSAGTAEILPNLKVRTGAVAYGRPALQDVLEL